MKNILLFALLLTLFPVLGLAQGSTLSDARVGEWAVYRAGNGKIVERHSVVARQRDVVVIKVETIINGRTISSKTENHFIGGNEFKMTGAPSESVEVNGQNYNAYSAPMGGNKVRFYSNQVPVTGLLMIRNGNKVVKELVNFGR